MPQYAAKDYHFKIIDGGALWKFIWQGGYFWGSKKYLASILGVLSTEVGYANGNTENPNYEDVCYKNTGHAEAIRVSYDPDVLPLSFLLIF